MRIPGTAGSHSPIYVRARQFRCLAHAILRDLGFMILLIYVNVSVTPPTGRIRSRTLQLN